MSPAWLRRSLTIPAIVLATAILIVTWPVLFPLALLADWAAGRPQAWARMLCFLIGYGLCEIAGLVASFALWLGAGAWIGFEAEPVQRAHYTLQRHWAAAIFATARACFGLRFDVEGEVPPPDRPLLVFPRHASLIDSFLPAVLFGAIGWRLRYVLKTELQLDPCLDVVGHRLPNHFLRRGSADAAGEADAIARLAHELGPGEGVLLFPEGTRFRPDRLDRNLAALAERDPARHARLCGLRQLLPPRTRGPQRVLEEAPDADICVMAHRGFEGFAGLRDLMGGGLVGRRIQLQLRVHARASVPAEPAARIAWLDTQWLAMDEWLASVDRPDAA